MSRTGISYKDFQNTNLVLLNPYYYGCFDSDITRIYGRDIPYSSLYVYRDIKEPCYNGKHSLYVWEHQDRSGYWCYAPVLTKKAQETLLACPSRIAKVFQLVCEIGNARYNRVGSADVEQLLQKLEAIMEQIELARTENTTE